MSAATNKQPDNNVIRLPKKPAGNRTLKASVIVAVLFFFFSLYQLNFDYSRLITGSVKFLNTLTLMIPPDVSEWRHVLAAALESLQVAILGTVFGIIIGFILAFPAADNLAPNKFIAWLIKGFASLLRAIPTLIWALIFIVAVGMGAFPGILAITVSAAGMLVKVFTQSIEEIDFGKIEALQATGAGWFSIITQAVIPTALTAFISWCILRFEADMGESTILGAVGAGGIGWELTHAMRTYNFDQAFFVAVVIFLMVFSVELVSNRLKMRLNKIS